MADPKVGFMGTSAIVASSLANAAGAAWGMKLDGATDVVIAVVGDGALEEGVYHEVLNIISLYQLPLIIVVEDNGWAVHSSLAERQAFEMENHARSYGLDTYHLGVAHEPGAIARAFGEIVESTRKDGRPRWVHINVFRVKEHVGPGDDFSAGYRPESTCEAWLREEWSGRSWPGRKSMEDRVASNIEEAFLRAATDPFPDPSALFDDVIG